AGFADCDGVADDGCEIDLTSDAGHCGACDSVCRNATTCQSGACSTAVCVGGYADCNGVPDDGCEATPASDRDNCGACGNVCSFATAPAECNDGVCGFSVCDTGYADCDGSSTNGCEVGLANDVADCGACGNACSFAHGAAVCSAGACALAACDPGY